MLSHVVEGFLEGEKEVPAQEEGKSSVAECGWFDFDRGRQVAQNPLDRFPHLNDQVAQARLADLDQPHDVTHGLGSLLGGLLDFPEIFQDFRVGARVQAADLAQQDDPTEVAADVVVQVARDLFPQADRVSPPQGPLADQHPYPPADRHSAEGSRSGGDN